MLGKDHFYWLLYHESNNYIVHTILEAGHSPVASWWSTVHSHSSNINVVGVEWMKSRYSVLSCC